MMGTDSEHRLGGVVRRSISPFTTRQLRLASGLVLFSYLSTHFLNHALGLVSLGAMEAGRQWFVLLWRNPAATTVLYGALLVHAALGLYSLYQRRHLRMPLWEAVQLSLGLAIPVLLAGHVASTRIAYELFDAADPYARVLLAFWVQSPARGVRQALLVVIAWAHGCMGLHYWLRLRSGYRRAAPALLAVALLGPLFALLGYVQGGREVRALARNPAWVQALERRTNALDASQRVAVARINKRMLDGFTVALLLVLGARAARGVFERRYRSIRLTYPGGRAVTVPIGFTVLEASRYAGIPHASVCGGRGRCSTCRVRIERGLRSLPRPSEDERRVLAQVGAGPDVRLACQTRPERDVTLTPLLPAAVEPAQAFAPADSRQGREQEVAVLFADVRGFTRLVEDKLPYDVVFILNRYFEAVGTAIRRAGGITSHFMGDGVMALFDPEDGATGGCRQAVHAAHLMVEAVSVLSEELADELNEPMRIGIGIHAGPAVVGRMGWGESIHLTAVGDTINVAARLEQATKDYGAELVISEAAAVLAGLDVRAFDQHDLTVRNRAQPVLVRVVARVSDLKEPPLPAV